MAKGNITFLPADGKGPSAGAAITDGQFHVDGLTPGKKIVQVVGEKGVQFARSSEEMARTAQQGAPRADTTGIVERADTIPPDAEGNNVEVEIKPGQQSLDFKLKAKKG